ncbi:MAG: NAD(P)H-dependent oxidoreductase subunit E [Opitutales bacterium]|nr:NAD(P)H-dependent oxidoreductase subunit E [Opitutales bacterium]
MEINSEIEQKCDAIIAQYPQKRSAAMMIMHLIQERFGFFDDSAIKFAAAKLGVEPVDVYGMLSFYPMFSDAPRGRVHIKVCRTLSCALAGSVKLGHELAKITGCPIGETRGIYTLEFVECLGNCVKGPNVQVNDRLFENVAAEDAEKFAEKIAKLDAEGKLAPKSAFDAPQGGGDFQSPEYKG